MTCLTTIIVLLGLAFLIWIVLQFSQSSSTTTKKITVFSFNFSGIDKNTEKQITNILDGTLAGDFRNAVEKLLPIINSTNLKWKELDEFINEYRPIYLEKIEDLKKQTPEWNNAGEKDREDMLQEFKQKALKSLDVRCYFDIAPLFEDISEDLAIDDALINKYGFENIHAYMRHATKTSKIRKVPPDSYEREKFESLVNAGLAIRGGDIPLPLILESLSLKELQELAQDLNPPKFNRKAKAIEFLQSLPDINQRLSKKVALREMFFLQPLPEEFKSVDFSKLKMVWRHTQLMAELLMHTYVGAKHTIQAIETTASAGMGYEILPADDPCKVCTQLIKQESRKKRPSTVPPFHPGCRCDVSPK